MDLKEKILDTENNKPDEMATSWITIDRQSALKAMDELSKIVAIAFSKWIPENAYIEEDEYYYCLLSNGCIVTSEQLYQLFTQSKEYKELMDQK